MFEGNWMMITEENLAEKPRFNKDIDIVKNRGVKPKRLDKEFEKET
jgi:hypothetical protein